jgi:hypothetical protein
MEWKNWSSHPVIVGVGIIIAVITLVNTLYKDHVKSGDSPSPSPSPITSINTPVKEIVSSPSPTVSPSESPQPIPSPISTSSPSPNPSIQTPVQKIISSPSPTISPSKSALSQKDSVNISFKNNSNNILKCWHVRAGGNLINFLMIEGQQVKHFDNFINSGSKIACSIELGSYSATLLTHFSIASTGNYEFLLDRVPLSNSQGGNTSRWATVVVYPNGQSYYSNPK